MVIFISIGIPWVNRLYDEADIRQPACGPPTRYSPRFDFRASTSRVMLSCTWSMRFSRVNSRISASLTLTSRWSRAQRSRRASIHFQVTSESQMAPQIPARQQRRTKAWDAVMRTSERWERSVGPGRRRRPEGRGATSCGHHCAPDDVQAAGGAADSKAGVDDQMLLRERTHARAHAD